MHPKIRRVYWPKTRVILVVFLLIFVAGMVGRLVRWSSRLTSETGLTPFTVVKLLFNTGAALTQFDGRTNIALLGIGGGNHAGADLTDTMMILSFRHDGKQLTLISLPRDIWSETLKDKINSAYHYGEGKKKGGGMVLAKVIMEDVAGIPIHYGLLIDFSGFQKIIDLVGGITLNVPVSFADPEFPIPGREEDECDGDPKLRCRYETLQFDAGMQRMDGMRALQYVRSRYAEGAEGSDFARARRQQEVFVALKNKLTKPVMWLSPSRLGKLFTAFADAIETDMNYGELATIGKILGRAQDDSIQRVSLVDELYTPPAIWYGRYVLLPKESFDAIHEYIQTELD